MITLLNKSGIISASQSKTNIPFTFNVTDGISEIIVNYSYSPKYVENEELARSLVKEGLKRYGENENETQAHLPVSNLITLSFDDPKGYRGACHRQSNKQKIIIGKSSTVGIYNGEVVKGVWKITLNVHFAGCDVNYKIEVKGVEK